MTDEQQAQKLDAISRLTSEEIEGWRSALGKHRPPFDGEPAALAAREKQLKGGR